MNDDIPQSVPQGGDGAQDAENSRIAAIADTLERICAVHETQPGDSQADVSRFETEQRAAEQMGRRLQKVDSPITLTRCGTLFLVMSLLTPTAIFMSWMQK